MTEKEYQRKLREYADLAKLRGEVGKALTKQMESISDDIFASGKFLWPLSACLEDNEVVVITMRPSLKGHGGIVYKDDGYALIARLGEEIQLVFETSPSYPASKILNVQITELEQKLSDKEAEVADYSAMVDPEARP